MVYDIRVIVEKVYIQYLNRLDYILMLVNIVLLVVIFIFIYSVGNIEFILLVVQKIMYYIFEFIVFFFFRINSLYVFIF